MSRKMFNVVTDVSEFIQQDAACITNGSLNRLLQTDCSRQNELSVVVATVVGFISHHPVCCKLKLNLQYLIKWGKQISTLQTLFRMKAADVHHCNFETYRFDILSKVLDEPDSVTPGVVIVGILRCATCAHVQLYLNQLWNSSRLLIFIRRLTDVCECIHNIVGSILVLLHEVRQGPLPGNRKHIVSRHDFAAEGRNWDGDFLLWQRNAKEPVTESLRTFWMLRENQGTELQIILCSHHFFGDEFLSENAHTRELLQQNLLACSPFHTNKCCRQLVAFATKLAWHSTQLRCRRWRVTQLESSVPFHHILQNVEKRAEVCSVKNRKLLPNLNRGVFKPRDAQNSVAPCLAAVGPLWNDKTPRASSYKVNRLVLFEFLLRAVLYRKILEEWRVGRGGSRSRPPQHGQENSAGKVTFWGRSCHKLHKTWSDEKFSFHVPEADRLLVLLVRRAYACWKSSFDAQTSIPSLWFSSKMGLQLFWGSVTGTKSYSSLEIKTTHHWHTQSGCTVSLCAAVNSHGRYTWPCAFRALK